MATAAWLGSVPFDVDIKVPVRVQLSHVKSEDVGRAGDDAPMCWTYARRERKDGVPPAV
jgi:hypothetical protein